jgi:hypothetical protein
VHKYVMKVFEVTSQDIAEWKASKELCQSNRGDSSLGASALSSCRSQGLRRRDSKVKHKVGGKRRKLGRSKVKGEKYGGPATDWSK